STSTSFIIEFSLPIDETAEFSWPSFFVNLYIIGDSSFVLNTANVSVSSDKKTVSLNNQTLQPDTKYTLIVMAARSTGLDSLEEPHVFTFTTGSSLPSGSISGKVDYGVQDPRGAVVQLLSDRDLLTPIGATVIIQADGSYTVPWLDYDEYYPIVVKDLDRDGEANFIYGDEPVGIYDTDGNSRIDVVNLTMGSDQKTDIDMSLQQPASRTAGSILPQAQQISQEFRPDFILLDIMADDLTTAGAGKFWLYHFSSPDSAEEIVVYASTVISLVETILYPSVFSLPLEPGWMDSDQAYTFTQEAGGADFAAFYPDFTLSAQLFKADLSIPLRKTNQSRTETRSDPSAGNSTFFPVKTVWNFNFYDGGSQNGLSIMIDAYSGEIVRDINPFGYTARANYSPVDSAAGEWAADAELVLVTPVSDDLDKEGNAGLWMFIYHSSSLNELMGFFGQGGRFLQMEPPPWQPPSLIPLPAGWLNSDSVLAIARQNGGEAFLTQHSNTVFEALLGTGYYPFGIGKAVWRVTFHSGSDSLLLFIDAITGDRLRDTAKSEITAREQLRTVQQQAVVWASDAVLTSIQPTCTLKAPATCPAWIYTYYSATLTKHRNFTLSADGSVSSGDPLAMPPSTEALPDYWIDSGPVMTAVQAAGGADYMVRNDSVRVNVQFSRNIYTYYGNSTQATWQFIYMSDSEEHLRLYVDPGSASILPSTALSAAYPSYSLPAANHAAKILGTDAELVSIESYGTVGQNGTAESWIYTYYSANADDFGTFHFYNAALVKATTGYHHIRTTDPLSAKLLDNQQVFAQAEAEGGTNFRIKYADTKVTALCSKNASVPGYSIKADRTVWVIRYTSQMGYAESIYIYDAETDEAILPTTIHTGTTERLPDRFELKQNYPNPFNDETVIEFSLVQGGHVVLKIYNLSGQLIRLVVNTSYQTGHHRAVWDGCDQAGDRMPSGIYIYRLSSSSVELTRRMVFLR
ncbi:T9SS type A sorting domain-containing protein, partial [candidate division KSB1 bacterium]|nr:T9SS type A sorting domain-containing protein [candidate division KSB1 bacterium]